MKRFFAILFSVTALVSATIFMSCSSDDSSSGGGGDNYYQGGGNNNYSNGTDTGSGSSSSGGNISEGQDSDTIPSRPENVTTKATSSSSIEVSWDAVDSADSYVVYYRLSLGAGNESYERDGTETVKTIKDTSVSINGLTEWKIYIFFVTAQNSTGESFANVVFDYPCSTNDPDESGNSGTTTTLSAPTGLIATAASSSSIQLSWNSVSGATGYKVYYSEYSYSSSASLLVSTTSTYTTATGLESNTKYYFWVQATNSTTTSSYSSYDYATTKMNWTPPTTYQELTNFGYENSISINVDKGNVYWFRLYAFQSSSQYKYTILFFDINYNTMFYSSDVVATYYDQNGNILKKNVDSGAWFGDPFCYKPLKSQYLYVKVECIRSGSFAICAERE